MPKTFMCGHDGCGILDICDKVCSFADDVMEQFSIDYKDREGEYPSMKLQTEVWLKAIAYWERKNAL